MGRLYLAERRGIEGFVKIVALKRILPHLSDSAQLKEMFLNEARVAARLEHPNIATTYELGEIDGTYFISMEYLPGEDLAATLARCQGEQRVPVDIAAALAQQAAHALHYAHEVCDARGKRIELVHRDVNPNNIFITYHGVVKLLDFGVAKDKDPKARKSVPGVFKGKYAYCAPEQLEGGKIDRRTDVFSLGIVLWECLTGTHMFAGNEAQIIDAVRTRRIEAPSVSRPEVPQALDDVTLRALARDPAQRYQSAQDFAEDLEKYLLEREPRPASKKIGRWLESMFGSERAALKRSLSQGGAAERSLERLAELDVVKPAADDPSARPSSRLASVRPRALWSSSVPQPTPGQSSPRLQAPPAPDAASRSSGPISRTRITASPVSEADGLPSSTELPPPVPGRTNPSFPGPAPRGRVGGVMVAAAGAAVLAVGLLVASSGRLTSKPTTDNSGGPLGMAAAVVDVRSQPPGAHIFVDGSPSGLRTPAVLRSLPTARPLEIRLDLPGYATAAEKVQLADGQIKQLAFTLREALAQVTFKGLPEGAVVFVDDARVEVDKPVAVATGSRRVRVEARGSDVYSRTVEIAAGQPIELDVSSNGSKP